MTQNDFAGQRRPNILRPLAILGLTGLVPAFAFGAGGENVQLALGSADKPYLYGAIACGLLAILYAWFIAGAVKKSSPGSEAMQAVGGAIKDGALAYLRKQIVAMAAFGAVLFLGLVGLYMQYGIPTALGVAGAFALGVLGSYAAGYTGMVMAVNGNMRVAHAALSSYKASLEIAFRSGAVAGLMTVGIGLVGAGAILLFGGEGAVRYLVGFGFGGSLAALFMRVGGGIFTKAADVGADLVGKVEAGIPEDDPRNPAVIADNVGDNVGDCAGMAADVFESYLVTLIAAIVLAAATSAVLDTATWTKLVVFSMLSAGIGIIASMIGISAVKGSDNLESDPLVPIRRGFYMSAVIAFLLTAGSAFFLFGDRSPVISRELVSVREFENDEVKFLQRVREDVAKKKFDEAKIKAALDKKAEELKKNVKDLTMADLFGDPEAIPADLQEVPQVVVQRVQLENKEPVKPYEITGGDLIRQKELKDRGFKAVDEMTVGSSLNVNTKQLPEPSEFAGYRLVTTDKDPSIPQLQYATQRIPDSNEQPTSAFATVGETYAGTGKDQIVVKKLRIKADIPAAGGVPGRKIDQEQWVGPIKLRQIEEQLEQQREQIKDQGINATIEDLATYPVRLYVGPDGRFALALPSEVERPHSLRGSMFSYFAVDVPTLENLQKNATPGMAPPMPPQEQMDLIVAKEKRVPWWAFVLTFGIGILLALGIEKLTEYYVSTHKKPTREVAGVSSGGAAPMIIQGFAYASESSAMMVGTLVAALLTPLFIFPAAAYGGYELGLFGIAVVGLGLLSTTGYVLAMDTFGPISDNAQGVYEMSGTGKDNESGATAVARLDAAGNTTKALTKGFAIATAVVASIALFNSYRSSAMLTDIGLKLDVPEIFLGLLIGGAAPFLFSAFAINAVGRSSFQLINEVRRQFRENPGIMEGTVKPDYARCVAIVTAAAQKELLGPGILAIALPAAVGFGFSIGQAPVEINGQMYNLAGAQALGGFLAGAILSGQLLAVLLANSGGMWDNAKKLIEDGNFGGKGSDAHKASVVCDTVGDPFKDTAGPALNPLIKVMNLVALLIVGVVIMPLTTPVLVGITVVCLGALAYAVYASKKGSFADDLNRVAE